MSSTLKILSEFGSPEKKALLIQLPDHISDCLEIEDDASVKTLSLLKALRKIAIDEILEQKTLEGIMNASDLEPEDRPLLELIFNRSIAIDTDKI